MKAGIRQVLVAAAALFNVGVNALAGAGLLFGVDTGSVSDTVDTGVTPAGWAFSIWSLIFVAVLVFAVYQALPRSRGPRLDVVAAPFVLANLLNGLWQFPWLTRNFGLAAVVIVGILGSLIWLYVRLDRLEMTRAERWTLGVPTSLFLGWLTLATPLNITVAMVAAGWEGSTLWPPLLVLVVTLIGAALLWRTGDVVFALVILWGFTAIYARNVPEQGAALGVALAAGALLTVASVVAALRRGRSPMPTGA